MPPKNRTPTTGAASVKLTPLAMVGAHLPLRKPPLPRSTAKVNNLIAAVATRKRKRIIPSPSSNILPSKRKRNLPSFPNLRPARPTKAQTTPSGLAPLFTRKAKEKATSPARLNCFSCHHVPLLTCHSQTKNTAKARTEKKEKVYLEIDAHFERPSRGGRGRGGDRGERDRGRGGRGRSRGGAFSASTPLISVDDEAAFPSLS